MRFRNLAAQEKDLNVTTVRGRIKASLWTIGIERVTELQTAWERKFGTKKDVQFKTLSRETARKWLRDVIEPTFLTPGYVSQLGELTGFSPTWLNTGNGEPQIKPPPEVAPGARELVKIYERLDEDDRAMVLRNARNALKAMQTQKV